MPPIYNSTVVRWVTGLYRQQTALAIFRPIQPAPEQHQVLFSYDLPYENKLSLDVPVPIDVSAAVVMLPPGGVKLQSDQLMAGGSRDVQGMTFQLVYRLQYFGGQSH